MAILLTLAIMNVFSSMAIGICGDEELIEIQIDGEHSSDQVYELIMEQLRSENGKRMSGDEIYQRAYDKVTGYVEPESK